MDKPPLIKLDRRRFKPDWKGYKNCIECEKATAEAQRDDTYQKTLEGIEDSIKKLETDDRFPPDEVEAIKEWWGLLSGGE